MYTGVEMYSRKQILFLGKVKSEHVPLEVRSYQRLGTQRFGPTQVCSHLRFSPIGGSVPLEIQSQNRFRIQRFGPIRGFGIRGLVPLQVHSYLRFWNQRFSPIRDSGIRGSGIKGSGIRDSGISGSVGESIQALLLEKLQDSKSSPAYELFYLTKTT